MEEMLINANIADIEGGFHPVRMRTVPRVGEIIQLWVHSEQFSGHHPTHLYEVVDVVHKLYDVVGEGQAPADCNDEHFITVHVRKWRRSAQRAPQGKFYIPQSKKEYLQLHSPFSGLGARLR